MREEQGWAEDEAVTDFAMEIDEAGLEERAEPVSVDQSTRLLARENRFGLRADPASWQAAEAPASTVVDVRLRCVAHRHPECRLRWVTLSVDVSGSEGTVLDLSPRDEVSTHPVRVATRYGGGLSLDILAIPPGPEVALERSSEQDVFFPQVTTSGPGFGSARWDFTQVGEAPLHVDRDLRLLVGLPADASEAQLHAVLRAGVSVNGALGAIPVVGRRRVRLHAAGVLQR
ncbi:hypothetical protein ABZ759_30990 [Streptomyces sp. NPDC047860]|uniref:hypothetical protein n=1 Tax=Streptomyces sp. NPDC047860 TaxID=3155743 RepID=UPI0033F07BBD